MDFPNLQDDQHAVLTVEVSTGIVLRHDRQWFIGSGETWRVFESLTAAREFAIAEVAAHPTFECAIFKGQDQQIQTVRNEEHVAALLAASRTKRKI